VANLLSGLWSALAARLSSGPLSFRRRADAAALAEQAEALRQLLETAPAALVTLTRDGHVATWNRAAERLFGWRQAEVAGLAPPFVPAESSAAEAALRQRVLAGNELFRRRVRFQGRDGEAIDLLASSAPQRDAGGAVIGVVSVFEELPPAPPPRPSSARSEFARPEFTRPEFALTEPVGAPRMASAPLTIQSGTNHAGAHRSAAQQPAPLQPVAAPATKLVPHTAAGIERPSQFLARVSHDLRQPLHALSLLTGALERRVKDPAALELVENAGTMVRSLQDSFDNVLDLARLEDGKVLAAPIDAPAADMIAPVIAEVARQAGRLGVTLRYVPTQLSVHADPVLLQRLLRQLLGNALRFAQHPDGTKGKVLVGVRRVDGRLRLIVADDGIGVPTDQTEAIFEPFRQLDAGRAAGGLGLGLAIAQRLAQLLQTRIELRSQPGKGSLFWVDLRRAPPR
jgi:PAS domain S-box-containing protein